MMIFKNKKVEVSVVTVRFKMPDKCKMLWFGHENISMVYKDGVATAWVPASDMQQARAKVQAVITNVVEWLD
jgi:hypothetical protein